MPDVNLTVSPPVAPLVTVTPAAVFVSLGNVVGAVGAGTSQFSVQGTGTPGNPYQLVNDAAAPGNWQFYATNGSGVKGWIAQGAITQFSLIGNGVSGTPLQLSGDTAVPGNSQYYGTDGGGARGFHALPGTFVADSIQGNGTPSTPYQLVGDVTTPSNGQFYAVSGGSRGWFTLASQDSVQGTGISGSQLQLVGDVTTPTNGQFYGYSGSARGWFTPPTATASTGGYLPAPPNNQTTFLRGDATFAPITIAAETVVATNLGSVSTNQTVNCQGACHVHIRLTLGAALTLTLTNLAVGVPVTILALSTGTFVIKLNATDPSSTSYAINAISTSGTTINMVSTGVTATAAAPAWFAGNSCYVSGTPTLDAGFLS